MQNQQLEARTLAIVDLVLAGQRVEDALIELKRGFPDPNAVARRLGGQANAARGEPILWVIGVDEKTGEIVPVAEDHADWLAQVRSSFDQLAPTVLDDRWVPVGDGRVLALLFDTGRGPYVVRNAAYGAAAGGPVQLEVPWREGTAVRSARRDDLLRILAPAARLPTIELLAAEGSRRSPDDVWRVKISCYVTPQEAGAHVVLPFHQARLAVAVPGGGFERCSRVFMDSYENRQAAAYLELDPDQDEDFTPAPSNVKRSMSELTLVGPGRVEIEADTPTRAGEFRVQLVLGVAAAVSPLVVEFALSQNRSGFLRLHLTPTT